MASVMNIVDPISAVGQCTGCSEDFPLSSALGLLVIGLVVALVVLLVQHHIRINPKAVWARVITVLIYLFGFVQLVAWHKVLLWVNPSDDSLWLVRTLVGLLMGIAFTSQFLITYEFSHRKKLSRAFFIKSLLAFVFFQLFVLADLAFS